MNFFIWHGETLVGTVELVDDETLVIARDDGPDGDVDVVGVTAASDVIRWDDDGDAITLPEVMHIRYDQLRVGDVMQLPFGRTAEVMWVRVPTGPNARYVQFRTAHGKARAEMRQRVCVARPQNSDTLLLEG